MWNKKSDIKKRAEDAFVRQQDQSDCGVACLLSVIHFFNGESKLERLRELSGTSKQGTTLLGLYESANQMGLKAEAYEADLKNLQKQTDLCILHVLKKECLKHYARALFQKPDLLLLDEATSAMDRGTEQDMLRLLMNLKEQMGIILVTHRVQSTKLSDRIYILEDGRIVNQGSPDKLVESQNLFSQSLEDVAL